MINIFKWCVDNYQKLLAIGALLFIISQIIDIINKVGFTLNIPLYFTYFSNLEIGTKMYSLAVLNFFFTLMIGMILLNKIKNK